MQMQIRLSEASEHPDEKVVFSPFSVSVHTVLSGGGNSAAASIAHMMVRAAVM